MKYYSTKLNRLFDTAKELEEAEKAYDEKQSEAEAKKARRAEAAKKVQDAYKRADEAKKSADDELAKFCKEYGSYHTTITSPAAKSLGLADLLNSFPFWF